MPKQVLWRGRSHEANNTSNTLRTITNIADMDPIITKTHTMCLKGPPLSQSGVSFAKDAHSMARMSTNVQGPATCQEGTYPCQRLLAQHNTKDRLCTMNINMPDVDTIIPHAKKEQHYARAKPHGANNGHHMPMGTTRWYWWKIHLLSSTIETVFLIYQSPLLP